MSQHVLHVADYGNRAPGSFVPAIVALSKELRAAGDRCSLLVRAVEGAVWHSDAAAALDSFATASTPREVFEGVWRAGADVVHVHFAGWALPATAAAYARGGRVIWHLHSSMESGAGPLRLAARAGKYALFGAGVHRFVAVSDTLRRATIAMGVAPARTTVLRNAVDTQRFRPPSPAERANARAALGIAPDERVVLFFGRDVAIKGADLLWNALDNAPPLTVLAVGLPPSAAAEFRKRVRTIELPFVADTAPLYWAADLLALPSRREAAPYTLLEALCAGLPAVASEIAPLAEIARETSGVRLVRSDPATLARALREPFAYAPAQVETARVRFGLERWVGEMRSLYAA